MIGSNIPTHIDSRSVLNSDKVNLPICRTLPMKAAVYTKTKTGKILEIVEVDTPTPKDDEVLVKVRAASVNPLDWRLKARLPGVDLAGEVVSVGSRVTAFKPGDFVFGAGKGAFAECACARESALAPKPEALTFEQAACMPIAGLTALQGLRDIGKLQPGQKVLINGAAGGVGTFAVQIAKFLGAEVTGVCSTRNVDLVKSLGADHVIDYTKEDFTKSAEHYDVMLDNVGNRSLSECKGVLTPKGKYVLIGGGGASDQGFLGGIGKALWAMVFSKFVNQQMGMMMADANQK